MRIGYGFCAARCKEKDDRFIILAGKKIEWRVGLFSDGEHDRDVVALAAADALVGAMSLGSIKHCTEADFDLKHKTGLQVLTQAARLLQEKCYTLANIDILVLLQDIRLAQYIPEMKQNLSSALDCSEDQINLKIDQEQWLGYTGSNDGINARAVCLIESK
ncbi:MAG: 2-C-methyl-D-erythritol 2,4-cyclodiphosphate synthase [Oscillospiraceae bacterium]|nr:2-C-methyl-D-erythritol 2,4-cyclodiphosphate synthase [Oscillospiraceae bacterium]